MRKLRLIVLIILVAAMLLPVNTALAAGNDKPLTQLIQEAEAKKNSLNKQKEALRIEWNKNQQLLADLAAFRDKAQRNTEKGVITLGSRLFKDAVAPLIKNHGSTVVNKLLGLGQSSNQSVSQTTISWANIRNKAVAAIADIQKRQKQITVLVQQIDKQIAQLNVQIANWKAAYKRATGYDYSYKPPVTKKPPTTAVTPVQKQYDYQAALGAWSADYAAAVNSRKYDDGVCKTTMEFEWVVQPYIKDGKVLGASRIWENDSYYAGPKAGTNNRWVANESYDASNPGVYISVGDLKSKYPQFNS
ncbi:MAG: hypothetical protein ACM3UZ_16485 [Acidobacteriota bacterium]